MSSVSDLIYTFDLAGRLTYANQPLLDLWQKPLSEVVGKNFFNLDYPPALADRLQQQIQQVITTRQPLKAETSYTSASGTRVYEYIFVPLFDADGAVEAVAGTGRDISDRKQVELALRESEQRFRTLTATVPQLIWTATPDGNVDYLSQQWADYIGLPPERLYDWHWQDVVHPEDLPNTLRDWRHSLERGEPVDIKHRFRFRTGEWRWQLVRGIPIADEAGQLTKWVGTCTDIQSESDAQSALHQREQRLTIAAEAAQLGVFEWIVPEDVALWENERVYEIFGHARADGTVSRQDFFKHYLHPDDAAAFAAKLSEGMQTGKLHQVACRIRRQDGEISWIEFNGQFELATDGSPLKLVGVIADITERKLAEQAAAADLTDMQRLHDLSTRLIFESDTQVLYDEILAATIAIMQADAGSIQLLNTQTNELTFLATQGLEPTLIDYFQSVSASSYTSCGMTLANGVRTFVAFDAPGVPDPDGSCKQHLDVGLRSAQSTPLTTRSGAVIGMLSTHWRARHRPSERELRFLDLLTRQAADLIERRQTEVALRASEELKQRILESSQDCIKVLTLNSEIAYISTGGLSLLAIDEPTSVLNTCWLDFWQGEDYEKARQAIEVAKAGNTGQFQGYLPNRKGTPKWWDSIITPLRNGAGQITQLVAVSRDITKQKQEEDSLRESEDRFRTMADNAPVMVWVTDSTGYCTYLSQSWYDFSGQTEETGLGFGWLNAIHPEDVEYAKNTFLTANACHEAFRVEYRLQRQDGEYRWVIDAASPWLGVEGQFEGYIGSVIDISDRKQAEAEREQLLQREQAAREEAQRANRVKDEFLAVLSHELRSPLNPILGWTRLLRQGNLAPALQLDALATIERNAKLQAQLIEDLLDISRIMQGKLTLTATPVSLAFVIAAAVETVRLAADAKSIHITLDLDPEVASVSGDAARLQQVVWNLLTNAVKFTDNGGQVTVQLSRVAAAGGLGEAMAQIRVSDTGQGINPQFLPHVFEYFRQADSSTTRSFGGLGLGLAIVRQIVEMHGGTVKAESKGEQQGATFLVQLPTLQASVVELAPTQAPATSELRLQKVNILLVEDDTDTREFETFLLEQQGATVIAAASGSEALQALDRSLPDVIVSDIGMAKVDGYALMQQLRSRPPTQGGTIPALALTAYAAEIDQQKALQAGYQKHLTKPLEPEQLVSAIITLLEVEV